MIITKLETAGKQKTNVYINEAYAFWLYNKEVDLFGLKEYDTILPEKLQDIVDNTVFYRAKLKALQLLQHMDRTEKELKDRLIKEAYPLDIVDKTMDYVRSFHYIDDVRYAVSYIRLKRMTKSKKQISMGLYAKGIYEDTIEQAYEELKESEGNMEDCEDAEIVAIRKIVSKKCSDLSTITKEEKLKISASLYRKGFSSENIRKVFSMEEFDSY